MRYTGLQVTMRIVGTHDQVLDTTPICVADSRPACLRSEAARDDLSPTGLGLQSQSLRSVH